MRRFFSVSLPCLALTLAAYGSGCGGSNNSVGSGGGGGDDGGPGQGGGTTIPHALGTVLLGESHAPSGGTSSPVVSAAFVPDVSQLPQSCSTQIGGCTFVTTPQCGTGNTCGAEETCAWDSACNATCKPACTLAVLHRAGVLLRGAQLAGVPSDGDLRRRRARLRRDDDADHPVPAVRVPGRRRRARRSSPAHRSRCRLPVRRTPASTSSTRSSPRPRSSRPTRRSTRSRRRPSSGRDRFPSRGRREATRSTSP